MGALFITTSFSLFIEVYGLNPTNGLLNLWTKNQRLWVAESYSTQLL
jgi:hypothetical protein